MMKRMILLAGVLLLVVGCSEADSQPVADSCYLQCTVNVYRDSGGEWCSTLPRRRMCNDWRVFLSREERAGS